MFFDNVYTYTTKKNINGKNASWQYGRESKRKCKNPEHNVVLQSEDWWQLCSFRYIFIFYSLTIPVNVEVMLIKQYYHIVDQHFWWYKDNDRRDASHKMLFPSDVANETRYYNVMLRIYIGKLSLSFSVILKPWIIIERFSNQINARDEFCT